MNFPKYWARATAAVAGARADVPREVACWRSSDASQEAAESDARAAVEALAVRLAAGEPFPERYLYGRGRPLREETIEVVASDDGEPTAVVTRNGYGCLILNTARAAFVDVDLDLDLRAPEAPSPRLGRTLFAVMFGAAAPRPREPAPVAPPKALVSWLAADDERGARVYRTAAGYRYLLTHATFDPASAECAVAFTALGCDPLYLQLCRAQKSFRARLTPKPWRCGAGSFRVPYPCRDEREAERVAMLLRAYEPKANRYATCAFVAALGSATVAPAIAPIVAFHDKATRAGSGLPLA